MITENRIQNTFPLVIHAQGTEHFSKRWFKMLDSDLSVKNFPENVTILTFATGKKSFPLLKQLKNNNIPFINCIPTRKEGWINKKKIPYLVEFIDQVQTDYVLVLDAIDILLTEDMSELITRFRKEDADILYNASKFDYPTLKIVEGENLDFPYLNAGALMGYTSKVKDFYQFTLDNHYKHCMNNVLSEQIRIRVARENYPTKDKIKVDIGCKIFQTLCQVDYTIENNKITI